MDYIAYLHQDGKSDFGVSFPDFPGAVTAGKTLQEAARLAKEVLAFHIKGMIEDGEPIPAPSTIDDIQKDPARKNAIVFLVPYTKNADKTLRLNITARQSHIFKIDELAKEAGMNRSTFLIQSALQARVVPAMNVPRANTKRLSNSKPLARKKKNTRRSIEQAFRM